MFVLKLFASSLNGNLVSRSDHLVIFPHSNIFGGSNKLTTSIHQSYHQLIISSFLFCFLDGLLYTTSEKLSQTQRLIERTLADNLSRNRLTVTSFGI